MLNKLIDSKTFFIFGLFLITFASLLVASNHQGAALNFMVISFVFLILGTIIYLLGL